MSNTNMPTTSSSNVSGTLFTPIVPPTITTIGHAELVEWKKKREEYEAQVRALCAHSKEDVGNVMVLVKDTIDRQLLKTCCELELDIEEQDLTEEKLVEYLDNIIKSVKTDWLPDIDKLFSTHLRMDLKECDVKARIVKYFWKCDEIISQHGFASIFEGENGQKEKCNVLKANLSPLELHTSVAQALRFADKETRQKPKLLYRLILEKALKQDKMHQLRCADGDHHHHRDKSDQPKRQMSSKGQRSKSIKVKSESHTERRKVTFGTNKYQEPATDEGVKCFECGGPHYKNDCPQLTEAEKERLAERREKKRSISKKVKRANSNLSTQRMARVNGELELPYCADTGSDLNLIARRHVEALSGKVPIVPLEKPVEVVVLGGQVFRCTEGVDIHIVMETAAGPVRLQERQRCVIIDSDEDELIIGNILLNELGIDVDRQLEMLAAQTTMDDDPLIEPELEIGTHAAGEVSPALEGMLVRALKRGLPRVNENKLRTLIHMYDLWRLVLGDDPPADVPPLKLKLVDGARPYKCRPRRYSPEKSALLEAMNRQLVELGWVYQNKESRWACPAVPVRKPKSDDFRQTSDYRPVNVLTDAIVGVIPNMNVILEHCRGKKFFAVFDFLKGFWQLPLHEDSQEILSYMTDRGVFTPTRVPQGCTDAALHFQATMELVLAELLYKSVLVWIDDVLVYADTADELLVVLEKLFSLLDARRLKLNPSKCELFLTEVKWCGRIIDANGVRHDPERIDGLCNIPIPTTAAELQQFICASNWMRESLPDYARLVDPLQRPLDQALCGSKKTKRAAAGIAVVLNDDEQKCFNETKELLRRAATLAYPDPSKPMCVLTDASDNGWGLVVTQIDDWRDDIPIANQRHELLVCMGGTFRGSELNWSVIEKEAYPIAFACDKLEYLLLRPQGFHLFCDHRNIIHLFAPAKELKKHVRGKLLRWSMKLRGYRYTLEHIDGPRTYGRTFFLGGEGRGRLRRTRRDEYAREREVRTMNKPTQTNQWSHDRWTMKDLSGRRSPRSRPSRTRGRT